MIGPYIVTFPIDYVSSRNEEPPISNREIAEQLFQSFKNGGSMTIPEGGWKVEWVGYFPYFIDGDGI